MLKTALLSVAFTFAAVCAAVADEASGALAVPSPSDVSGPACLLQPGGESAVLAVLAPQTLHLADGRFVRLSEVFIPPRQRSGFDPAAAATDYLRKIALGRRVEIKFGGAQQDRYGVYVAHVFVKTGGAVWLQQSLVQAGLALAYPQSDNRACAADLEAAENIARSLNLGYWGLALFKVFHTADRQDILDAVQTYQVVEGKVVSASGGSTKMFLNFGQDRTRDFTVTLEPSASRKFPAKNPSNWPGTIIRVRGWIERRRGPLITVLHSEQIEFLPGGAGNRD